MGSPIAHKLGDNGAPPPVMANFNLPKLGCAIGYREPDAPTEPRTAYLTYDGERFAGLLSSRILGQILNPMAKRWQF